MYRLFFLLALATLASCSTMNITNVCTVGNADDVVDSAMTQEQKSEGDFGFTD